MRCNMIEANEMERTKRIDVNIVWCIRDKMSNVRTVCMLYIVYATVSAANSSWKAKSLVNVHHFFNIFLCLRSTAIYREEFYRKSFIEDMEEPSNGLFINII